MTNPANNTPDDMTTSNENLARWPEARIYVIGVVLLSRIVPLANQTPAAAMAVLLFPFLGVLPALLLPGRVARVARTVGVASAGAAFAMSSLYFGLFDGPRWWLRLVDFSCALVGAVLVASVVLRSRLE